ncbi:MAG: HD domain-containing protein [Crenarchaeota archaeon]|nr:HD domain-containing protein [Thermoproteota archaeon]
MNATTHYCKYLRSSYELRYGFYAMPKFRCELYNYEKTFSLDYLRTRTLEELVESFIQEYCTKCPAYSRATGLPKKIEELRKTWEEKTYKLLEKIEELFPYYTRHGPDHAERILTIIHEMIKSYDINLTDEEWNILVAAAYLHDIGMSKEVIIKLCEQQDPQNIPDFCREILREGTIDPHKVRKYHHKISAKYVERFSEELNIDPSLATFIAKLCRSHRGYKDDLEGVEKEVRYKVNNTIRLRLLAILLILADEFDSWFERVYTEESKMKRKLGELLEKVQQGDKVAEESLQHWIAHLLVSGIQLSRKPPVVKIGMLDKIPESIENEICSKLGKEKLSRIVEGARSLIRKQCEKLNELFNVVMQIMEDYGITDFPVKVVLR